MESKRFLLLDIDYVTDNDEAVVRLFGKLQGEEENKSIIARDRNFKPYIYVLPNEIEECIADLRELNIKKIEKVRKKDVGIIKEFLKITLKHPQDVPKLREKIWNLSSVDAVREHDIPFYRRYLIDKGLFPMSEVKVQGNSIKSKSENDLCIFEIEGEPEPLPSGLPELKVLSFDIEACNPKGMPQENKDPIIMISLSSNQGLRKVYSTKSSSFDFVEVVNTEKELIEKFVEVVKSENPDLITGYNTDVFDFPYIRDRASRLGVTLDLGVDGSPLKFMRRGFANSAVIKGRIHVDLYPSMRRFLQLDRYTLERVYLEIFEEEKFDIDGEDIHSLGVTRISRKIGYVFQEHSAPFSYPALEVVRMGRAPHLGLFESPSPRDTEIAEQIMKTLGISHLRDKRYTEISGGERQLVLIARTLCQEPEIILLDEPTSHLDFRNQALVLDRVKQLSQQGMTILMTTHFPNHAWLFSSRVAMMNHGRFVAVGPPDETMSEANLSDTYGIEVRIFTAAGKNGDRQVKVCVPALEV